MSFTATWMELEIIILSEINKKERQAPQDTTYVWNLKYDTNDLINETEIDREQTCGCQRKEGWGRNGVGFGDQQMQTDMYRMDKQQGLVVQHRELYLISFDKSHNVKECEKDVFICMSESLCYTSEISTL